MRQEHDLAACKEVFNFLEISDASINDCQRMGKHKENSNRKLLVTLNSVWSVRKILANSYKLKDFKDKVFLSPGLSPIDTQIEQQLLKKRFELIEDGNDRKSIKIKAL